MNIYRVFLCVWYMVIDISIGVIFEEYGVGRGNREYFSVLEMFIIFWFGVEFMDV